MAGKETLYEMLKEYLKIHEHDKFLNDETIIFKLNHVELTVGVIKETIKCCDYCAFDYRRFTSTCNKCVNLDKYKVDLTKNSDQPDPVTMQKG